MSADIGNVIIEELKEKMLEESNKEKMKNDSNLRKREQRN